MRSVSIVVGLVCILSASGCASLRFGRGVPVVDQSNRSLSGTQDWGQQIGQSFTAGVEGMLTALRVAIDQCESPRELLVYLQTADGEGRPTGQVLASGTLLIDAGGKKGVHWYEIPFSRPCHQGKNERLIYLLVPGAPSGAFGYFEYGYSKGDAYPGGCVFTGIGRYRERNTDFDLLFETVVLR
jgi:hypothetical protein